MSPLKNIMDYAVGSADPAMLGYLIAEENRRLPELYCRLGDLVYTRTADNGSVTDEETALMYMIREAKSNISRLEAALSDVLEGRVPAAAEPEPQIEADPVAEPASAELPEPEPAQEPEPIPEPESIPEPKPEPEPVPEPVAIPEPIIPPAPAFVPTEIPEQKPVEPEAPAVFDDPGERTTTVNSSWQPGRIDSFRPEPAAPNAEPAKSFCTGCGSALLPGAAFCLVCGKKVPRPAAQPPKPAEPPVQQPPRKRFCTRCGKQLLHDTPFCPSCGAKLN